MCPPWRLNWEYSPLSGSVRPGLPPPTGGTTRHVLLPVGHRRTGPSPTRWGNCCSARYMQQPPVHSLRLWVRRNFRYLHRFLPGSSRPRGRRKFQAQKLIYDGSIPSREGAAKGVVSHEPVWSIPTHVSASLQVFNISFRFCSFATLLNSIGIRNLGQ
jgi:hypothetical protein